MPKHSKTSPLLSKSRVLARSEIEKGAKVGKEVAKKFLQKETKRIRRRKSTFLT